MSDAIPQEAKIEDEEESNNGVLVVCDTCLHFCLFVVKSCEQS